MKRVKARAAMTLVFAAMIIVGLCIYVLRLADDGEMWATARFNTHLYSSGISSIGTVKDRNGVVLADADGDERSYASDTAVRTACLHAVGDYSGNIGTGALSAFAGKMSGYDMINGLYNASGESVITLSIDSELCAAAYSALAGRKGAVLVSDYKTGEMLCMVSSGSYDPENGAPDITDSAYEGVFVNRAISSVYTPGSVFKLVTVAAAIETMPDLFERSFRCDGSVEIDGRVITCSGTHGSQTIEQALANSCNCAFAELALELGADVIAEYAEKYGLTDSHELSGIRTAAGSYEKAEKGSAELAWSGIGQYTDLVSPYAMLRLVSAAANGGTLIEPVLTAGERSRKTPLMTAETAQTLKELMANNVSYAYGPWNFPGLKLCAKTGTAEVGDGTSHSWFVGFVDDDEHPLAFTAVIEHGGSGLTNAGSAVNTVLQAAVRLGY